MRLKETLYVSICVCFWLLAQFQHLFATGVLSKRLFCESAFATYQTVCLQMKLNYVQCICFNNANSFSQEEGKCCDLNKNVKQLATFSALNTNMLKALFKQKSSSVDVFFLLL